MKNIVSANLEAAPLHWKVTRSKDEPTSPDSLGTFAAGVQKLVSVTLTQCGRAGVWTEWNQSVKLSFEEEAAAAVFKH